MSRPAWVDELWIADEPEIVANRFSGQSVELCPEAVAVYDYAIGCEMMGQYTQLRKALDYFRKNWPSEYMVLLD